MKCEIESIHGSDHRMIYYRVTDDQGGVQSYGPVVTTDSAFDAQAHCAVVLVKVTEQLAQAEFDALVGGS